MNKNKKITFNKNEIKLMKFILGKTNDNELKEMLVKFSENELCKKIELNKLSSLDLYKKFSNCK